MTPHPVDVPSGRPASIPTPSPDDPRLARLSLNQRTITAWSVPETIDACVRSGVPSIGLWREPVADYGLKETVARIEESGLRVSSLCRAGFFATQDDPEWNRAVDETKRAIEEASELGAACLAIVPGGMAIGTTDVAAARERFRRGLDQVVPVARDYGVHLAVEPLHPMYCADRGVICTISHALEIVEAYPVEDVGLVLDAYHIWWDPALYESIRAASDRISAYQACDWIVPFDADMHTSRAMMGDGYVDLPGLTAALDAAGFRGDIEIEIFNHALWDAPPQEALDTILRRYVEHVAPVDSVDTTSGKEAT